MSGKKKHVHIRIDELIADVDAIEVAEGIGMELNRSSKTVFAECISGMHKESRYTHNSLWKHGCHCFSCGASYGTFNMVAQFFEQNGKSLDFMDICEILAQYSGNELSYYADDEIATKGKKFKKFPLSAEEIMLLEFSSDDFLSFSSISYKEGRNRSGELFYSTEKNYMNLKKLHHENESLFNNLITRKGESILKKTDFLINNYKNSKSITGKKLYVEFRRRKKIIQECLERVKE